MSKSPYDNPGLEHFTAQMHQNQIEAQRLLNQAINRWTRWLYPDDDSAVPYQDSPAPRRRNGWFR